MGAKAKAVRMEQRGNSSLFVTNVSKVIRETRLRRKSMSHERDHQAINDIFASMEESDQFGEWSVAGSGSRRSKFYMRQQRRRSYLS